MRVVFARLTALMSIVVLLLLPLIVTVADGVVGFAPHGQSSTELQMPSPSASAHPGGASGLASIGGASTTTGPPVSLAASVFPLPPPSGIPCSKEHAASDHTNTNRSSMFTVTEAGVGNSDFC